jgi:protein involved in polysaccharide export with SLBB domain
MIRRILFALAFIALCSGFKFRASGVEPKKESVSIRSKEQGETERQIVKGDQLSFRILEDEEPARRLTVSESGQIRVPYLGGVTALNKTPRALALEIKRALEKNLYKNATVILSLEKRSGRTGGRIYLTGEIAKPGALDLRGSEELTVSRAILLAGGFSEFANKRKVRLIHKAGDTETTVIIDIIEILEKGRVDLDKPVEAGDVIIVPARLINW